MSFETEELRVELERCTAVPVVQNADQYLQICELRKANRRLRDEVIARFDPAIKKAQEAVATIRALKAEFADPLDQALTLIDNAIDRYEKQEAAHKAVAEKRLADEMAATAERERQAQVATLIKTGYVRDSKRLAEAPLEVVLPTIPTTIPKVEGFGKRDNWSAEVIDLLALVKAVAAGKAPLECLSPNLPTLNTLARTSKTALAIPGVRAVNHPVRSQRR